MLKRIIILTGIVLLLWLGHYIYQLYLFGKGVQEDIRLGKNYQLQNPLILTPERPWFVGTYYGACAESFWTIELLNDSTFEYRTEGHIGNTFTTGTLTFQGDTIYLEPTSGQGFSDRKGFVNYKDSCLIGVDYWISKNMKISWDFCKGRTDNWTSERWNLETLTRIETE